MKLVGRLLLGIVVLAVVAVGALVFLTQQKPSVARGLRDVAVTQAAASSFDEKINAVLKAGEAARKAGKAAPVEVTLTEEELTSKLSSLATQPNDAGLTTKNTQIHLQGGNVVGTSDLTIQGIQLSVGVVAQPVVVNGSTQIVIKEIQTGALPIPDALKQQLNAQIGQAMDPKALGLPMDVSKIQIVDGKIVIGGTTKP